ncbi:MAG: aspartate 1-decarboxylase [bacterium]
MHRATVTEANLQYVGSVTISEELMEAADILPYEQVHVLDIDNGNRLETYAIPGPRGSGDICLNGAAARLVHKDDKVIIITYCEVGEKELAGFAPKLIFVDERNKIVQTEDVAPPKAMIVEPFCDVC